MYHILFSHSSVDEHLGCFQFLTIVNSTTANTAVQVFPWYVDLESVRYMGRSSNSWFYIFLSQSSEKPECDFHNDYINLYSNRNMKIFPTLLAFVDRLAYIKY